MRNILIINTHQYYPFSEWKLSQTMIDNMSDILWKSWFNIDYTTMKDEYDVEKEIEKHKWADAIILQIPVNWMWVSWSFKKYMDEVYTAWMMGEMSDGDGRTRKDPLKQYGTWGILTDTKYMLSLTFNAPKESFNDENQWFFAGKSEDDLFYPTHMNFKFFGMQPLKTFVSYDVMKNPDIENDLKRLKAHIETQFNIK